MSEQHPTAPTTVYGAAKLAGESYARAYFETYRYPTVVVRPFNAFGPRSHHEGDSGEVIPKFMLRCLAGLPVIIFGDGEQTRDFTYVADTARGIMMAGLERRAVGSTVNIGSGTELSINRLAREVAAVVGVGEPRIEHLERRPGEVRRLIADAALARELLAFVPSTSLRDGLARLRDWYRERGRTPVEMLAEESVRNWEPGRAPAPV
jgi:UDP-glucose 4-epimerase